MGIGIERGTREMEMERRWGEVAFQETEGVVKSEDGEREGRMDYKKV